jgi:FGGY-family pentulose kinase
MTAEHFIGVDVGTGSVRAGIFDGAGRMLATAKRDIALWQDGPDIAEQSSRDIWDAVCASVRQAVERAGVTPDAIAGLGFDATCSLVVLGVGGAPLPVGPHGDADRNVIVWMDHRAIEQAERINRTAHPVLDYVGGRISPEMETPKLLWLKEHLPATYRSAWQFLDLADFLGWRATGSLDRSACTVTCKWTYLAHRGAWDASYFNLIGLEDLAEAGFARIGTRIVAPGTPLGGGLTPTAAAELGLRPGTPVGAGLIDAHAGGVGSIGLRSPIGAPLTRMAYIFGTSACTMTSAAEALHIPGIWGPYHSAMLPSLWLNEGGQSGAGAAIDQLVAMHPASREAQERAGAAGQGIAEWLADQAVTGAKSPSGAARLAGQFVVVPDFLGNRSPHADPEARGVIAGLGMGRDLDDLVSLYVAGVLGIGYGLRQILDATAKAGSTVEALVLSGGAGRHPLVQQLLADCTGLPVLSAASVDPVMRGAAMLGATAGGAFATLSDAIAGMSPQAGSTSTPATGELADMHNRRYAAFTRLQQAAREARDLLGPAARA